MFPGRRSSIMIVSCIALIAFICLDAGAYGAQEAGSVREVRGFDSVSFGTSGELIITQGDRESLDIVASASDLARIVTEVRDGKLFIGREGPGPVIQLRPPVFRLTMKTVVGLEAHSSGRISAKSLHSDSLRIQIGSSGQVAIDSLAADSLEARLHSSGSLRVAGKVNELEVLLSSSGSYSGRQLESRTARVRVTSSGSATVRVSDSLQAVVTSSGHLWYYGNPQGVDGKVTSSGRLVRLGD